MFSSKDNKKSNNGRWMELISLVEYLVHNNSCPMIKSNSQ